MFCLIFILFIMTFPFLSFCLLVIYLTQSSFSDTESTMYDHYGKKLKDGDVIRFVRYTRDPGRLYRVKEVMNYKGKTRFHTIPLDPKDGWGSFELGNYQSEDIYIVENNEQPLNQMTEEERTIHCMSTTELCRLEQQGNKLAKEELKLRYEKDK